MERGGEIHPLQTELSFPYQKVNAPNLVKFIFQIAKAKDYHLELEFKAYLRQAKKFIDEVGEEKTLELVQKAIRVSENGFSFPFLRRLYEEEVSKAEIQ